MSAIRGRLLLAAAFLCPWVTGLITVEGLRLSASDLLLVPVLVCLVLSVRAADWSAPQLGLISFGFIAALSTLSLLSASFLPLVLMKVVRLFGVLVPALLVTRQNVGAAPVRGMERAFFWGGLLSVAYGAMAFYFQWESGVAVQSYYYGSAYLRRAGGTFLDASAFGHLLATWFVVTVLFVAPALERRLARVGVVLLAAGLTAYGLYASVSRAALLHLLVVGAGAVLLPKELHRRPVLRLTLASLGGLCLVGVATGLWDLPVLEPVRFVFSRMQQTVEALSEGVEALDRSGGNRLSSWVAALQLWMQAPLLGVGYKALGPSYGLFVDNTLVLTLVETGVLGCLTFTATGVALIGGAGRAYASGAVGGRRLLLFWLGQMTHSLVVDTVTFSGSTTVVLLLGFAWTFELARRGALDARMGWSGDWKPQRAVPAPPWREAHWP